MQCRMVELRYKEVINICDGCRLGFVGDVEVLLPEGRVTALIVPGPCRFFGLFGRGEEYYVPWDCIKQIGDDIILVEQAGGAAAALPGPAAEAAAVLGEEKAAKREEFFRKFPDFYPKSPCDPGKDMVLYFSITHSDLDVRPVPPAAVGPAGERAGGNETKFNGGNNQPWQVSYP